MSVIRIEIPMLPPGELNPNWKGHWAVKAKAAGNFRGLAWGYAYQAKRRGDAPSKKAEVQISFVIQDRRYRRDTDNALASVKPAIDGAVDAGVIANDGPDCLSYKMPVVYEIDKERAPMTILEFKELKNDT